MRQDLDVEVPNGRRIVAEPFEFPVDPEGRRLLSSLSRRCGNQELGLRGPMRRLRNLDLDASRSSGRFRGCAHNCPNGGALVKLARGVLRRAQSIRYSKLSR